MNMNVAVRYYTRSGNTAKLAEAVGNAVGAPAQTIETPLESKVDILFLGCSYYAFDMDPQVKQFITENRENIGKIALFGTSAMMKSMKKPMEKVLEGTGIALAAEEFHCRGSFGIAHKGRPNADDCKAAQAFAQNIIK